MKWLRRMKEDDGMNGVNKMKRAKRRGSRKAAVLAALGILLGMVFVMRESFDARAEEEAVTSQSGQLMRAEEDVDMKAEPKSDAKTLMSYRAGDSIFVTGETEDGWYRAIYQDKEGYLPKDSLSLQEIDVAGLDEEMARTEQEAKLVVETVDRYRTQARRSKIWGSVIVVLVLGIFATGIVSGIKSSKKKEE